MRLTEFEKDKLVDRVRTAAQKLRTYQDGLRLYCSDEQVLNHLLDTAETWASFFPIYLPTNLSETVYRVKANGGKHVFSIAGDSTLLLEQLWHLFAFHSNEDIRGCFQVTKSRPNGDGLSKRLNILIGKPQDSTDDTFDEFVKDLSSQSANTVDLTSLFLPPANFSKGLTPRIASAILATDRERRKVVLQYLKTALLKHYKPNIEGHFIPSLPPNNLLDADAWYTSDFRQSRDAKLADALESVVLSSQVDELARRLSVNRIMIVGGLGSGSDFLARRAMLNFAKNSNSGGLFRVLQFACTESTADALLEFLSDDLHSRGTGVVLRDLLDPVTALWLHNQDSYEKRSGFLHGPAGAVLHNNDVKDFLDSVSREDKYEDTKIIITSQYDSLAQLTAAFERKYAAGFSLKHERRIEAVNILNSITESQFWNPARNMNSLMMRETTNAIFKVWLTLDSNNMPKWLNEWQRQIDALIGHGYIKGMYRIAAWSRIWLGILDKFEGTTDFATIERAAEEYSSQVAVVHEALHSTVQLGVDMGRE